MGPGSMMKSRLGMKSLLFFLVTLVPVFAWCQDRVSVDEVPATNVSGEKIVYRWNVDPAAVSLTASFSKLKQDQDWILKVESAAQDGSRNAVSVDSTVLSKIVDESWVDFEKREPTATLKTIGFDVSICPDIWRELESGLKAGMLKLEGHAGPKSKPLTDLFSEILSAAAGLATIKKTISEHGQMIWDAGAWDMVMIDEVYWGRPWNEVARAPYSGLKRPVIAGLSLKHR